MPFFFFFFLNVCLFLERGEGREKGEKHWLAVSRTPPAGELGRIPVMCPVRESNQSPFDFSGQPPFHWAIPVSARFKCFFLKKIVFYWLCYYSFPDFLTSLLHSTQPPLLPHTIPTPLFMSTFHAQVLWLLHFLYWTLHPHGYSVTTYLCFLIPSPLHPFSYTLLPFGNHQTLSVSMILSVFLFA